MALSCDNVCNYKLYLTLPNICKHQTCRLCNDSISVLRSTLDYVEAKCVSPYIVINFRWIMLFLLTWQPPTGDAASFLCFHAFTNASFTWRQMTERSSFPDDNAMSLFVPVMPHVVHTWLCLAYGIIAIMLSISRLPWQVTWCWCLVMRMQNRRHRRLVIVCTQVRRQFEITNLCNGGKKHDGKTFLT